MTETRVWSSTASCLSLVDSTIQLGNIIDSNIQGYLRDIKASGIISFDVQSEWFETIQSIMNPADGSICPHGNDQHSLRPR